jgi:hypothetical protein
MDEKQMLLAQEEIDKQIAKIERMLDKRGTSGSNFDDFLGEEKTRLYGMLQIYWLLGGEGYLQYKTRK